MDKICCAACGAELDEDRALLPEQRLPCATCGSTDRRIAVEISSAVEIDSALTITPRKMRTIGMDAVVYAEPAMVTVTAHDATVHAEDAPADTEPIETQALVTQGFGLRWHQLTASPPTWMAQVFDAAGEPLATVVGDDLVQLYADLAEWLLPHHPG
jgi:hypothetical protein